MIQCKKIYNYTTYASNHR